MDILTWAQNQIGNGGSHYQSVCGIGSGDAWCAAFITTGMIECGEFAAIGNTKRATASEYSGGSSSYQGYFKSIGQYFDANSGYTPQPGDIVCWGKGATATNNMGSHVGIVESVGADGTVYTIEGNRKKDGTKQVIRDSYTPGTSAWANISGFAQPHYGQAPVGGGNYSAVGGVGGSDASGGLDAYKGGMNLGIGIYEYQDYTVQNGDTIESVAEKFNISPDLLISYNGLDRWDTLEPGTVLHIPELKYHTDNPVSASTEDVQRGHTASIKAYHPVLKVEFYAEGQALTATSESWDLAVYGDAAFDFDIISCATQRNIASDCPTMTITLTNRQDWYNILGSNDLVIVRMRRPEYGDDAKEYDEPEQEVFIGVIDDIRRTLDFSSGFPKRAIQVTARGLGKALVNFDVGLIKNIALDFNVGFMGNTQRNPDGSEVADAEPALMQLTQMNSADAIQYVFERFVGRIIRFHFYNGKGIRDYVEYDGTPHDYEILQDFVTYSQYSGSLWNFFKELTNAPFNETFWEIRDGKAVLFHRPSPFDPEPWGKLKRIVIRDDDLVSDGTGRSDLETYTVYTVNLRFLNTDFGQFYNPLWYQPYYEKYGLSQLSVMTSYGVDFSEDPMEAIRYYATEVFNWNIKNNRFANGQLVVKGRASYKVGQTVVTEYNGLEYYVEGVAHNFTVYGGWTTTLSVTRGILPSERFTEPYGMGQEMTTDTMQKIIMLAEGADVDWTTVLEGEEFMTQGTGLGSMSGGYDANGQWVGGSAASGQTIEVPAGMGTLYTHMGWSMVDSKSSNQYKLKMAAGERYDKNGFGSIDGRYVIAVTPKFGQPGDFLTIQFTDGHVMQAIIGDLKGNDAKSEWGHVEGNEVSVIEFVVNKECGMWSHYGGKKVATDFLPWLKSATPKSITNTGNWWTAHGQQIPN